MYPTPHSSSCLAASAKLMHMQFLLPFLIYPILILTCEAKNAVDVKNYAGADSIVAADVAHLFQIAKIYFKRTKEPILPAERKLFEAAIKGDVAVCFAEPNHVIRADHLVWLCCDKEASRLVSYKGIAISDAIIDGEVNMDFATIAFPLRTTNCHFNGTLSLQHAELVSLILQSTTVQDIEADGVNVKQNVFFRDNFVAHGTVRLSQATIGGDLDCDNAQLLNEGGEKWALNVQNAMIGGRVLLEDHFRSIGEVQISGASIHGVLACSGGQFENDDGIAVHAESSYIGGDVFLDDGFKSTGEVRMMCTIQGDLICDGGQFTNANGRTLIVATEEVHGTVSLGKGFISRGEVYIKSKIDQDLRCSGGSLSNPGKVALSAAGVKILGSVYLNEGFVADGAVLFPGAEVGQAFSCRGGRFSNTNGVAIDASSMTVKRSVSLNNQFVAEGQVNLSGVDIGGDLNCNTGQFITNGSSPALYCVAAKVNGNLLLGDGFRAVGGVDFATASVGLLTSNGEFLNPSGESLSVNSAEIQKGIFLRGAYCYGTVDLIKVTIRQGNLELNGAHLNAVQGNSLDANSASVGGHVFLREGFIANGRVDISHANIDGDLDCSCGHFRSNNNEVGAGRGQAICASSTKIAQNLRFDDAAGDSSLADRFTAEGTVQVASVRVGGDMVCQGGLFFSGPLRDMALDADSAEVEGSITLTKRFVMHGVGSFKYTRVGRDFSLQQIDRSGDMTLHLEFSKFGTLVNDRDSWPNERKLFLHGCAFDLIDRGNHRDSANTQLDWIRVQHDSAGSQPYQQLFSIFRGMGLEDEAAKVMICKNDALGNKILGSDHNRFRSDWKALIGESPDRSHSIWHPLKKMRDLVHHFCKEGWEVCWYRGLGWLIGFGFYPQHALYVSIIIVVFGWFVFERAYIYKVMLPTSDDACHWNTTQVKDRYPKFNAFVYSLEAFVPLVKLGVEEKWTPNANRNANVHAGRVNLRVPGGVFRWYLWIHILCGWVFTTLWVGGFTGLLKT
jgi:hypothetical protein